MRTERGASGLFIAVILILVAAVALAILALTGGSANVERGTQVADRFKVLEAALQQYVTANGRLPCPANPALDTGDADPAAASAVCNSAQGSVPWKAIGVRREDSIDAWGGKIAYRVFAGNTGLTQDTGASMVNCDTVEPAPAGVDASGLCRATQNTTEAEFLAGKGLVVAAFGTALADVAYVLISHGPTGLGAFTTAGTQKMLPASAGELANTSAAGPFVAQAASAQGVGPGDAAHYDDVLAYARIGDLIRRAGMGGRDWPEPAPPPPPPPIVTSVKFDRATLGMGYGDTGQSAIALPDVTIRAFNSGGAQNINLDVVGGMDGVGVGSNPLISSSGGEGIRLEFPQKVRKLGVTLNDFGFSGAFRERAELRFFDGLALVATLVATGCNSANPDPPASFSFSSLPADFDYVEIRALVTTPNPGGSVRDSEFLVSAVAACTAAAVTCDSPLQDAANACP